MAYDKLVRGWVEGGHRSSLCPKSASDQFSRDGIPQPPDDRDIP